LGWSGRGEQDVTTEEYKWMEGEGVGVVWEVGGVVGLCVQLEME
jgi:hypothetical protein